MTRERIGLPPRDARGWTVDEIVAYEHAMQAAMIRAAHPAYIVDAGMGQPISILPGKV
jgi:hypothetical protein